MSKTSTTDGSTHAKNARRFAVIVIASLLAIFGIASVTQGLDGRSAVQDGLGLEKVVGTPQMTPAGIEAKVQQAGVKGVDLPSCSVAGKAITTGDDARCFAQYMRVDALIATGGKTYSEMPRFATADGKGTNVEAQALMAEGRPVNNPARNVWVTETALSTALNTSYMAERISLFGIAVGGAFLLVGLTLGGFALAGMRLPRKALAASRKGAPSPAHA